MPTEMLTILNKRGLHARASSKLTKLAEKFESDIWLTRNGYRVNAKSIMGVLTLAATKGSIVELETIGPDATQAMEALKALINDYFGEDE